MRHLWSTDSTCHHCGYDGCGLSEAVKQGYSLEELGGIHCREGTTPNPAPLAEFEDEWWDYVP